MSEPWVNWAKTAMDALPDEPGRVKVAYRCNSCQSVEAVYIEVRKDEEPLDYYMNKVSRAIKIKHSLKSLDCKSKKVDLVFRFPATEDAKVGGQ